MINFHKNIYSKQRALVIDNASDHFEYIKDGAVQMNFQDIESQGVLYKGIVIMPKVDYGPIEKALGFKVTNKISFLRAYKDEPGYRNPSWIHSDALFADFIGIHMIQSSKFPQDDGVSFWKNKELNSFGIDPVDHTGNDNKIVDGQSLDPEKWEISERVEFKENRLVIAPAFLFHSKTSYGNYGTTNETCRIVEVLFFNRESK